jgi:hypothetical protein
MEKDQTLISLDKLASDLLKMGWGAKEVAIIINEVTKSPRIKIV